MEKRVSDVMLKYQNGEEGEFWRNLFRGSIFRGNFIEEMGATELPPTEEDSISDFEPIDSLSTLEEYITHLGNYNPAWADEESTERFSSLSNNEAVMKTLNPNKRGKEMLGLPPMPVFTVQPTDKRLEYCPFIIKKNELFGRHFVSNRKIKRGEIVLIEPPLVVAPLSKHPYCLNCLTQTTAEFYCPECGFFICSLECKSEMHEWECSVLSRIKLMDETDNLKRFQNDAIRARIENLPPEKRPQAEIIWKHAKEAALRARKDESMRFYPLIAVSRTYIAMRRSKFIKSLVLSLQANVDKKLKQYAVNQHHIVAPLSTKVWEEEKPVIFHRIASVWDTNSFEVSFGWQYRGQGIFPGATLLTHSCRANLQQWFTEDGIMVIRALEDIEPDCLLSICYSEPLWPTRVRVDHLELTKRFSCTCERCSHKTELGSHMGTIKCTECGNYLTPENPLDPATIWNCVEPCSFSLTAKQVVAVDSSMAPSLRKITTGDLDRRNETLKEMLEKFHPHHHLVTRLHLGFVDQYSKRDLSECSDEIISALVDSTKEAMEVISLTDAALSNKRARTGREYIRCRLEQLRRKRQLDPDADIKDQLQELQNQLDESKMVLSWDSRMPDMDQVQDLYQQLFIS